MRWANASWRFTDSGGLDAETRAVEGAGGDSMRGILVVIVGGGRGGGRAEVRSCVRT